MAVPFCDLARLHRPFKDEFVQIFQDSLTNCDFVLGPALAEFEGSFTRMMGASYGVGVASGTDALLLTLHALGVGQGDEVICPAFGFVATTDVIARQGASVVFVDVDDEFLIDCQAVRAAITEKTKAIIAVHLFGRAADVETLAQIAADYDVYLIEDCAQAAGAEINGRAVGTFGMAGCFSFYPTKNLGALGDGGLVLTGSDELAARVRLYRDHGRDPDQPDTFVVIGYNSRLDSIQAALLNLKLESLREDNADRVEIAHYYDEHLLPDVFSRPIFRNDGSHVYHQYTIRYGQRDELRTFLSERQIESRIYYGFALHLQPCFEYLGYREGHFPNAELAAQQVLSIPIFPGLTTKEVQEVAHTIELYSKTHPVPAAT